MKVKLFAIFLIFLMVGWAGASGFLLYEFGAASSAMGAATLARAWDASTVFYNPSGIAFLEDGAHFYGGVTLISATNKFTGAEPVFIDEKHQSVARIHHPIGIYFTYQFNKSMYAGIGVTNPFGLGLEWREVDFPGRSIAYNTDLKSFYISPVFAYKFTESFSASVGLDIVLGDITLQRYVRMFDSEGSPGIEVAKTSIEGTSNIAYGFTASLQYKEENFGLGFLYRHSVENKLEEADATFSYLDTDARLVAETNLVNQKVNSAITFPNFFGVGVYYKFLENFGAEVDFLWYNWSVFDELILDFENPDLYTVIPEEYENSMQFRLGIHYDFAENWQLRAGYIYDQTPQPIQSVSPLLPDNDRNDYSIGLGYTLDKWQFDAGYMLVDFGERSTVENGVGKNHDGFNGTYASIANLFFFSLGYHFE